MLMFHVLITRLTIWFVTLQNQQIMQLIFFILFKECSHFFLFHELFLGK
jgi:hypothetical protein